MWTNAQLKYSWIKVYLGGARVVWLQWISNTSAYYLIICAMHLDASRS